MRTEVLKLCFYLVLNIDPASPTHLASIRLSSYTLIRIYGANKHKSQ